MEAMVIIIYIGRSDISRTKWRACKTGFNSLLSVCTRSNASVLRNENGATLREKQRMADQHLTHIQKQHRWIYTALRVTEL